MSNAPGLDMSEYTSSSSDHLTTDDFLGGPRVLTITEAGPTGQTGKGARPVYILFEGEPRAFLPSLTVRRVLAKIWTAEDNKRANKTYPGRSLRLFVDPEVTFGEKGQGTIKVGGIRVNGASHIDQTVTGTTVSGRNKRAPFSVEPLKIDPPAPKQDQEAERTKRLDYISRGETKIGPEAVAEVRAAFGADDSSPETWNDDTQRAYLDLLVKRAKG